MQTKFSRIAHTTFKVERARYKPCKPNTVSVAVTSPCYRSCRSLPCCHVSTVSSLWVRQSPRSASKNNRKIGNKLHAAAAAAGYNYIPYSPNIAIHVTGMKKGTVCVSARSACPDLCSCRTERKQHNQNLM